MTLNSFDILFYTLAFVVPGFVLYTTLSMFVPLKSDQGQVSLLRFLFLSCINYAIWSWLVYYMVKTDFSIIHPLRTAALWGLIILISPILLGVLGGYLSKKELVRRTFQRVGLNPVHVIPTAWDYKFSTIKDRLWVIVTLKDGSSVTGTFSSKSFVSSDEKDRDLYLEEVYDVLDTGPWEKVPRTQGILIRGDQIKHIEFFQDEVER